MDNEIEKKMVEVLDSLIAELSPQMGLKATDRLFSITKDIENRIEEKENLKPRIKQKFNTGFEERYIPPINMDMYDDYINQVVKKRADTIDDAVICTVNEVLDITVDKLELERALRYDRDQYNKGYEDGIKAGIEKLAEKLKYSAVATHKSIDDECRYVISNALIDDIVDELVGD